MGSEFQRRIRSNDRQFYEQIEISEAWVRISLDTLLLIIVLTNRVKLSFGCTERFQRGGVSRLAMSAASCSISWWMMPLDARIDLPPRT